MIFLTGTNALRTGSDLAASELLSPRVGTRLQLALKCAAHEDPGAIP